MFAARPSQRDREILARRATYVGVSVSQYVADLLAIAVGRPDCARKLTEPLTGPCGLGEEAEVKLPAYWSTRVPVEVYDLINAATPDHGRAVADYLADVCHAHAQNQPLPLLSEVGELLLT